MQLAYNKKAVLSQGNARCSMFLPIPNDFSIVIKCILHSLRKR